MPVLPDRRPGPFVRPRMDSYFIRDEKAALMSATVAFIVIAICVLAIFAVGAAGWWMTSATLSGADHEDDREPPMGGRAV